MPINNLTQTISTLPPAGRRGVDVQTVFVIKQEDFQDHLQGTTVAELNTLKTQINTTVTGMNIAVETINTKASEASASASSASTSASTATTKASEASTSATSATTSRNQAETFAQQAQASATSVDVNNIVYRTNDESIAGVKTFSSSPIVPTPTTGTQAVNKDYVDDKPTLPIGAILNAYTIINNCIVAFGGEFNRADYPKLWAYLQANPTLVKTQAQWTTESTANGGICGFFSSGNGTTTFRVPNLDKAFLRPDNRAVGSFQGDAIRNITGKIGNQDIGNMTTSGVFYFGNGGNRWNLSGAVDGSAVDAIFDASTVVPTSTENRPKNIAVLPLIVAK